MQLLIFLSISIILLNQVNSYRVEHGQRCYNEYRRAKKCTPPFINAAYNLKFEASNTCGTSGPSEYCIQSSLQSISNYDGNKKCFICDARNSANSHGVEYLTDYHSQNRLTWWQSDTMLKEIQYPHSVNLTLNLNKKFEINYIQIKFHSPRPESFAIYKRVINTNDSEWIPYQYYSASCEQTYNLRSSTSASVSNEEEALCNDENSDISPISGAVIVFSTLDGRPSAQRFETSDVLKNWLTATAIRITLNRLNTYGDELVAGEQALKSYYYAISDISIGARCGCNGHAGECLPDSSGDFACRCEHFTDGVDCEKCLPFYNDVPWKAATESDPFECQQCNCNGYSYECFFDQDLYTRTGHGGHCLNCRDNREGVHCENCKTGFYRLGEDPRCRDCGCNPVGSESLQCDSLGICKCKPGVTGDKCDRCASNFYDLTETGCKPCTCDNSGSLTPIRCSEIDGTCACKENVEGKNCDKCKPGYYNLQENNQLGCLKCFCFGHSSECQSSLNHELLQISSSKSDQNEFKLTNGNFRITYDSSIDTFIIKNDNNAYVSENVYLTLPAAYLGNKRLSFNQDLSFQLKLTHDADSIRSRADIIIENSNEGLEVYRLIDLHYTQLLANQPKTFNFKLNPSANWVPKLSVNQFQRLLSNVTAIKIRVNYHNSIQGETHISGVSLIGAKLIDSNNNNNVNNELAPFVEQCKCPIGYRGQFCDQCQEGYRRENPRDGSFSRCIPCTCNNHSTSCDQITGKCSCLHHTTGDNCEQCEHGYFGNALLGTANDCKKCPCPNNGPCSELHNYQTEKTEVACLECPTGTTGNLCEICDDGYFSVNPTESKCEQCICNNNIDANAIGNCDTTSGKCLRCIYNTTGDQCERCLPGYWGNALSSLKCHACECYPPGTKESAFNANFEDIQCDLNDGKCNCKPNVRGRQCNECNDGFWNITSNNGCVECNCNLLGSLNASCNIRTGQCNCRPGVTGLKCDKCLPNYYDFTYEGCKPCECDPFGSKSLQCDDTGKCPCKENISGQKCNRCEENKYNFTIGCVKCEDCYNLVQDKTNKLRNRIIKIESDLNTLTAQSTNQNNNENLELKQKLEELKMSIDKLHNKIYIQNGLKDTYDATIKFLSGEVQFINNFTKSAEKQLNIFYEKFRIAELNYTKASETLKNCENQLKIIENEIKNYEVKLDELKQADNNNDNENSKNDKLKKLAKLARETSSKHVATAEKLTNDVNKLLNDLRSINLATVLNNHKNLLNLISNLNDTSNTRDLVDSLLVDAKSSKDLIISYISDLKTLINALNNFKLPDQFNNIDNDERVFREFIDQTNQERINVISKLNDFKAALQNYLDFDYKSKLYNANEKFEKSKRNNNDLNELNQVITSLKTTCDTSIRNLEQAYTNATFMLETLKNFDNNINLSKEKATQAESLKPEIQSNVAKSHDLIKELRENLQTYSIRSVDEVNIVSTKKKKNLYKSILFIRFLIMKWFLFILAIGQITEPIKGFISKLKNNK